METMTMPGLSLYFDVEDRDAAELIGQACARAVPLIHELWGLGTPEDLRVYVLTAFPRSVFVSAPWSWRILLGITFPLWYPRQRKMWQYAGGWEQPFGRRRTVGVKPPRLMQEADGSIGVRIFVPRRDIQERVEFTACHELAHAFVAHLKLPAWLKEGHAMVTVDRYAGKETVLAETLEALERFSAEASEGSYQKISMNDPDGAVYLYTRGYWITRYLHETQPELLRGLLVDRMPHQALENRMAASLGTDRVEFWRSIDQAVVSHFRQQTPANNG
jgi:hypothetical protein